MEIGSISKSAGISPAWPVASRGVAEPAGPTPGTRTELPARAVVSQAAELPAVGDTARRSDAAGSDTVEPRVIIDTDTRQMVFQSVDGFTGEVVRQTPDKALLRQRAYVIQVEDQKAAADAAKSDVERRV